MQSPFSYCPDSFCTPSLSFSLFHSLLLSPSSGLDDNANALSLLVSYFDSVFLPRSVFFGFSHTTDRVADANGHLRRRRRDRASERTFTILKVVNSQELFLPWDGGNCPNLGSCELGCAAPGSRLPLAVATGFYWFKFSFKVALFITSRIVCYAFVAFAILSDQFFLIL